MSIDSFNMLDSKAESILVPFLGAIQASLSVLLTISAGVIAAQLGLLDDASSKKISTFCVRMALPALLITNVGSQLDLETGIRYVPIVIWAIFYTTVSIAIGFLLTKVFGMPDWVIPAIAFNNTTSLPLLLVQSLDATGILSSIDDSSGVVSKAKSYFLVNAMIGNSLTFALGPKLLNGQEEEAPDKSGDDNEDDETDGENDIESQEQDAVERNEQTSLLPKPLAAKGTRARYFAYGKGSKFWSSLSPTTRSILDFLYSFINAPVIGALLGALVGLVPALHRLFFNEPEEGGYLNAWLTSAIKNVGELFAVLQVIVVGVKLSRAILQYKNGNDSKDSRVPPVPFMVVTFIRFILWPIISIGIIYLLASRTNLVTQDALLWFCLMLMPTGPPAMKLSALADCEGSEDSEKMLIAKFLTMSYMISPLICFTVVGALKASESLAGR
ncbi:membrane transporter [Colletotrichum graminicola]|uniref:Membrane transporter n=1 Tax=Colletotrichum graminicola (strain M1.001 / M2 / FGSC 10212) TaxID=645133 RepID=E3Q8V0_COLGM|nr:membrane transporter [Colletotrichum graminicola M1.001]EFQ27464.1 membrane transporter [Colletotrichum graminicola M1.001]WDK13273.1 membrane transporter [Colletotrichum graminicola]